MKIKNKKGKKLDLTKFLEDVTTDDLPKGPGGNPHEQRRPYHRGGEYNDSYRGGDYNDSYRGNGSGDGRMRGSPDDGGDSYRNPSYGREGRDTSFAADSDVKWRQSQFSSGRSDGDSNGENRMTPSAAENDDNWRSPPDSFRDDSGSKNRNIPSAADDKNDWRDYSTPTGSDRNDNTAANPSAADNSNDWRDISTPTGRDRNDNAAVNPSAADNSNDWRDNSIPMGRDCNDNTATNPFAADNDKNWRESPQSGRDDGETKSKVIPSHTENDENWRKSSGSIRDSGETKANAISYAAYNDENWRGSPTTSNDIGDAKVSTAAVDDDNNLNVGPYPSDRNGSDHGISVSPPANDEDDWRSPSSAVSGGNMGRSPLPAANINKTWRHSCSNEKLARKMNVSAAYNDNQWRQKDNIPSRCANESEITEADGLASPIVHEESITPAPTSAEAVKVSKVASVKNDEEISREAVSYAESKVDVVTNSKLNKYDIEDKEAVAESSNELLPKNETLNVVKEPYKYQKPIIQAEKWDDTFTMENMDAKRRYGDKSDDIEREKLFKENSTRRELAEKPGAHAFSNTRKSQLMRENFGSPSLFSSYGTGEPVTSRMLPGGNTKDRNDRGSSNFSGGRHDRERASMVFGGSRRDKDDDRVRRERAALAFNGGRRDRDDDRMRREEDRERASMVFGGGRREKEDDRVRREEDRERASMVFGGGRRDKEDDRVRRDEERERSAMAFNTGRRSDRSGLRTGSVLQHADSSSIPLAEIKPKSRHEGDEIKPVQNLEKNKQAPAKLSYEVMESKTQAMLRTYAVVENRMEAVNAAKSINDNEYHPRLVECTIIKIFEEETLKCCKLMVTLLVQLRKDDFLSFKDISSGLKLLVEKVSDNKEKLKWIQTACELLVERDALNVNDLDETTNTLLLPNLANEIEATISEPSDENKKLLDELLGSEKRGNELACCAEYFGSVDNVGAEFVKELLNSNPDFMNQVDQAWLDQEEYGLLLGKLIYSDNPTAVQANVLLEIQSAFNSVGFPRDRAGQALIEKAFMKLYNNDIVSVEAIISWSEEISDEHGKTAAIVQLAEFVSWLQSSNDDEE